MNSTPMEITLRAALAALCLAAGSAAGLNHDAVVTPLAPGPFAVACSNVAQDPALIAQSGSAPEDFWVGRPANGEPRYISQILAAPGTALRFLAPVPDIRSLYPQFAGDSVEHVAIVCHPTPRTNGDPDYVLPGTGDRVPRMQPAGALPRLIGATEYAAGFGPTQVARGGAISAGPPPREPPARLPLIVFSHGLGGSPISPGHISALVDLASYGFMVGAVFHGDPRFSRIRLEDLGDFFYLLTDFDRVVEMELMRPVSLKAMVDVLLAHPGFAPAIDAGRIGGFGASLGGQAMANLLGARLTTTIGLACRETVRDPRIKAAVGLVPYAGQTFLPAFCDDQSGADDVDRPYLALSGTADTTAPIRMMEQAIHRFGSSHYLVELVGVPHEYRPEYKDDVFTWTVTFLRAYLGGPGAPAAIERFVRMAGVAGGIEDNLRVDVHEPMALAFGEQPVVEFYQNSLDHYLIAAGTQEIARVASGGAGPGWSATTLAFKVPSLAGPDAGTGPREAPLRAGVPVCRFYGKPAGGSDTYFFTASVPECESAKQSGKWSYEGIGFWAVPVGSDGRCPPDHLQVLRAYNNGLARNDMNYRYATSDSILREMVRRGWTDEGAVMCARF